MAVDNAFDKYVDFMKRVAREESYSSKIHEIVNVWSTMKDTLTDDQVQKCMEVASIMAAVAEIQSSVTETLQRVFITLANLKCECQVSILRDASESPGMETEIVMNNTTHQCAISGNVVSNITKVTFYDTLVKKVHWVTPGIELDLVKIFYLYGNFDKRIADSVSRGDNVQTEHFWDEFEYARSTVEATSRMFHNVM